MLNNLPYDPHVLSAMDSAYTFYKHMKTAPYRRGGVGSTSEWVSWRVLYKSSELMYKSLSQSIKKQEALHSNEQVVVKNKLTQEDKNM